METRFLAFKPYVWEGYRSPGTVIFGMELKKSKIKGKIQTLSDAVYEQYGIRIFIVNRDMLKPWFEAGILPIERYETQSLSVS